MTAILAGIAIAERRKGPMVQCDRADVTVDAGILGDARGTFRKRQITVLFLPSWVEACAEVSADLPWTMRRANFLVDGMTAPQRPGSRLRVGDVVLEVTQETHPCEVMERAHPGLREALRPDWRGGVCCSVLVGGHVAVGDPVTLLGQYVGGVETAL